MALLHGYSRESITRLGTVNAKLCIEPREIQPFNGHDYCRLYAATVFESTLRYFCKKKKVQVPDRLIGCSPTIAECAGSKEDARQSLTRVIVCPCGVVVRSAQFTRASVRLKLALNRRSMSVMPEFSDS